MRIDSRHGIKRLAAKCVAVCSMQARVHDFSGRQLAPRLVCVINAIQIQRMQIVEGSNELVAPTGISGLVLARYSMTDSPLSLLLPSLLQFPTLSTTTISCLGRTNRAP